MDGGEEWYGVEKSRLVGEASAVLARPWMPLYYTRLTWPEADNNACAKERFVQSVSEEKLYVLLRQRWLIGLTRQPFRWNGDALIHGDA